jgi:hypothetical protein
MYEHARRQTSFKRGPSWNAEVQDPVWVTRVLLEPRPTEQEHVLSRYQIDVHLGNAQPIELHLGGKKLKRVAHFGDMTWTPAGILAVRHGRSPETPDL